MQPRSEPCSVSVTNAAPGSSRAAARQWPAHRGACLRSGAPAGRAPTALAVVVLRCVATIVRRETAATTASRAIRSNAAAVSASSLRVAADRAMGRIRILVPAATRSRSIDMATAPPSIEDASRGPTSGQCTRSPRIRAGRHSPRPGRPAETRHTQESTVPFVHPLIRSSAPTAVPTRLAEREPDGSVRCGVCAQRCLVRPGRTGICGVRENRDGTLVCTVYGAVAAVGVDPIEKKPLFHVAPGTLAYSIATVGCPFHCAFCQNWEIAQAPRLGLDLPTRRMSPARVVDEAARRTAPRRSPTPTSSRRSSWSTRSTRRASPAHAGLLNLFVTDGYATPEAIDLLAPVLDAANVDLKSLRRRVLPAPAAARGWRRCSTRSQAYRRAGIWLEVTTLVIPGHNDDPGELRALAGWIVEHLGPETPWHVSRFFPAFRMRDVPPTPLDTLRRAAEIGREAGLRPRVRRQRAGARPGGHAVRGLRRRARRAPRLPRARISRMRLVPGLRPELAGGSCPSPGRSGAPRARADDVTTPDGRDAAVGRRRGGDVLPGRPRRPRSARRCSLARCARPPDRLPAARSDRAAARATAGHPRAARRPRLLGRALRRLGLLGPGASFAASAPGDRRRPGHQPPGGLARRRRRLGHGRMGRRPARCDVDRPSRPRSWRWAPRSSPTATRTAASTRSRSSCRSSAPRPGRPDRPARRSGPGPGRRDRGRSDAWARCSPTPGGRRPDRPGDQLGHGALPAGRRVRARRRRRSCRRSWGCTRRGLAARGGCRQPGSAASPAACAGSSPPWSGSRRCGRWARRRGCRPRRATSADAGGPRPDGRLPRRGVRRLTAWQADPDRHRLTRMGRVIIVGTWPTPEP